MVGRTLRDQAADLVERHRIHLIGILRPSPKGGEDALVEPDTRIASGDRMLLAGTEAGLAGLRDREG
jgi:Trk K+ transport system NAD-binding subunit